MNNTPSVLVMYAHLFTLALHCWNWINEHRRTETITATNERGEKDKRSNNRNNSNQPIIKELKIGSRLQAQAAQVHNEHVIGRVMRTVNAQFRLEFCPLSLSLTHTSNLHHCSLQCAFVVSRFGCFFSFPFLVPFRCISSLFIPRPKLIRTVSSSSPTPSAACIQCTRGECKCGQIISISFYFITYLIWLGNKH